MRSRRYHSLMYGRTLYFDAPNIVMAHSATLSLLAEIWAFLRVRKKWWLAPIFLVLVLFGALMIVAQGSALAPFIYTIF